MPARGRMGSEPTKRKPVWKWIPKVKNVPNQHLGSPYKQALLSNPNGNELEGQKNANEAVDKDVHEGLSDNDNDEEIASSLRPFDGPLEIELQLHEKSERRKLSSDGKKSISKISKSSHNSPTPTEFAEEALQLGKSLGISIIADETLAIRRVTRSLRKKLENKQQGRDGVLVAVLSCLVAVLSFFIVARVMPN
ncbi:hypothetical protein Cgig2_014854 [Carnegiea gigantea]|uniref:Uncharacterized protein n=1 Tax=Carnegiea gigantea TaxID=171969 RepID=A0A9Q1QTL1_9CARY|nr:hypothetical protein Cgig2_014854 [Carnegiea gigantea]